MRRNRRAILTGFLGVTAGGLLGHHGGTTATDDTTTETPHPCPTTTETTSSDPAIVSVDGNVKVLSHHLEHGGLFPNVYVRVKNTSGQRLSSIKARARLYDKDGIRIAEGTDEKNDILAGHGVRLNVPCTGAGANEGSNYKLWITATR